MTSTVWLDITSRQLASFCNRQLVTDQIILLDIPRPAMRFMVIRKVVSLTFPNLRAPMQTRTQNVITPSTHRGKDRKTRKCHGHNKRKSWVWKWPGDAQVQTRIFRATCALPRPHAARYVQMLRVLAIWPWNSARSSSSCQTMTIAGLKLLKSYEIRRKPQLSHKHFIKTLLASHENQWALWEARKTASVLDSAFSCKGSACQTGGLHLR